MTSQQRGEASRKRLPDTPAATTQPVRGDSNGHEGYMRLLGDRVRWLERHRHWWLRTEVGRLQREFIERRDAA